jgi:L-malate glycosyltransferase
MGAPFVSPLIKRVRDVVRIFSLVQRELPSALIMIGDGPDLASAQQEARVLGVSDCTFFLGKLDFVAPFLACADLFLLPSQNESFGLSALEALACGVPVVASRAGGLLEVVEDGVTGALRDVGDVAAMATAAIDILRRLDRWAKMSTVAAADARVRFSRADIVDQYESFYARILK